MYFRMQDRRRGVGQFDRRIQLIKPVSVPNRLNEPKTGEEIVYSNFPAWRKDPGLTDEQNTKNNASRSVTEVDFEIHFIPDLMIGANKILTDWKIKDEFSGEVYKVVAPATELGRRYRILIHTELVR